VQPAEPGARQKSRPRRGLLASVAPGPEAQQEESGEDDEEQEAASTTEGLEGEGEQGREESGLGAEGDDGEGQERQEPDGELDQGVRRGRLPGVDGAAPSRGPDYTFRPCSSGFAVTAAQGRRGTASGPRASSTTE
jgi:hypothetical protein